VVPEDEGVVADVGDVGSSRADTGERRMDREPHVRQVAAIAIISLAIGVGENSD
jgi:hypothetical protein